MAGLLRVAFVNTSETTSVTVHIEAQDAVEFCELLPTAPATAPGVSQGMKRAPQPGGWPLVVAPGTIVGFVTNHPVKITNPNSAAVTTIYADGKDPWPEPPPPSPLATKLGDFSTRYGNFLAAASVPNAKPKPIVMTLTPAHMNP